MSENAGQIWSYLAISRLVTHQQHPLISAGIDKHQVPPPRLHRQDLPLNHKLIEQPELFYGHEQQRELNP